MRLIYFLLFFKSFITTFIVFSSEKNLVYIVTSLHSFQKDTLLVETTRLILLPTEMGSIF